MSRSAAGQRRYRKSHPDYAARSKRQNTARTRAMRALARRHADEYRALYTAELRMIEYVIPRVTP